METIPLMMRAQFAWIASSCLCFSIVLSQRAHAEPAADPAPASAPPALPKAAAESVKLPAGEISLRPPLRLRLTEPTFVPITTTRKRRNEVMVFGLRIPTLIAFGLGGLSAGGAVTTGFIARRGNDPGSCDTCSDHHVSQQALLVTTGVLTGLAAVGVGVGIAFMIKAPKDPTRDAIRPRFDLGLSGEKAVAKVGWTFKSL